MGVDTATGEFVCDDGSRHGFLPEQAPDGPTAEFVSLEPDTNSPDGRKHYAVNESEIREFYQRSGKTYPAQRAQAAPAAPPAPPAQ